ncbi:TPA: type II toxin-antitoxin system HicB family antitoxin [Legionella pneumophila]|nr:type II toxin-antitoxin system HicB family antitoxin [Legionella pneumophila]HAU1624380.1 type II toxin-antitoxin system HicB family antitoxin [Legionella pneumophila]HAW6255876.1 type II toxin-antitoxin system HicB family antitoxin [Legionella pneumophila]HBD7200266.1 type II toxin-antitoxin system HicB family antitoxin [Legionella pneumophila]HBD9373069.1 type II toxin-antitoxin system HicB family antitoxin [Legionella pneumophila]
MRYPVVIHKDEHSDFGVIVPDIPGCYSSGSTYDEALTNVIEAIECHLEGLLIDNEPLPVGTTIDRWINDEEFQGGVWAFIDIDLSQISGKAKRINITMPERILSLIDLYAKNHAIKNRSSFLADAALSYMESHK